MAETALQHKFRVVYPDFTAHTQHHWLSQRRFYDFLPYISSGLDPTVIINNIYNEFYNTTNVFNITNSYGTELETVGSSDEFPLKQALYINSEHNNIADVGNTTPITVVSHIAATNSIVVSHVPYVDTLLTPTDSRMNWAILNIDSSNTPNPALSGDYTKVALVSSANYSTKRIKLKTGYNIANFPIGSKLAFYNPFQNYDYDFGQSTPIPEINGAIDYSPGGILNLGDRYILFINISSDTGNFIINRIYYSVSTDLITWSTPVLMLSPNQTWCTKSIYLFGSVLKSSDDDRYCMHLGGTVTTDSIFRVSYCHFRVTGSTVTDIEVCPTTIIDPALGSFASQVVIHYKGKYLMYVSNRIGSVANGTWEPWVFKSDTITGPFLPVGKVLDIPFTNRNAFYSNHVDNFRPIIWRNRLLVFIGGTPRWNESGFKANRVIGLAYADDNGMLTVDRRGPLLVNPQYGDELWGQEHRDFIDHTGGYLQLVSKDGSLYMIVSMNAGSNTYRVAIKKLKIAK